MIDSPLIETLVSGFSLGLLTGTTCFATCGPIYMPFLMQKKLSLFQSVFMILEISAGRFVSYISFGIIAGLLGQSIAGLGQHKVIFTAIAYFAFSVMLIMSVFSTRKKEKGCAVSRWRKYAEAPFLLGVVTGINFCPSFLIALTDAVGLNGPLSGGVLFFGFYMGTNVYLLPLSVFGVMGNQKVFRKIAMVASILVGGWFIFKAITLTIGIISPRHAETTQTDSVISLLDGRDIFILHSDSENMAVLETALGQYTKGTIRSSADAGLLPDSGALLISAAYNENVITEAKKMLRPGRFVVVLPESDSTGYDNPYSSKVAAYFQKYYFKQDKEKGTFFNMSHLKESGISGVRSEDGSRAENSADSQENE